MEEKQRLLDWLNKQEHFRMSVIANRAKMHKSKLSRLLSGDTKEFDEKDFKRLLKVCKAVGYAENKATEN